MNLPEDARKAGATPHWIGYVGVDDVDAAVDRIKQLGGAVHVPPTDVPNISRFSVVADPQMATLALVKGLKPGQEQSAELDAPGRVGWHELLAADWEKAFAFYGELFGWQKADADIGAMGTYQLFSAGGQTIGGMFTKPPTLPLPFWLYYFNIGDIEAAAKRVKAGGGQILYGPIEVPGGAGSSIARTLRAPYSRWWKSGAAKLSDISSASQRAILPTRGAGDGLGKAGNRRLMAIDLAAFGRGVAICVAVARATPKPVRLSVGSLRFRAATDRKLTDRALDVEFDPRHLREQIDIGDPDRTSAEPHVGRHQVERLHQYADVLQNERIGDRAVLP